MRSLILSSLIFCLPLGGFNSCTTKSVTTKNISEAKKSITVFGIAENAKAGAVVLTDQKQTYYVDQLDSWPDAFHGKKVKVTGYLRSVEHKAEDLKNEKGEWVQGMVGTQNIIDDAKWELAQ